MLDRFCRFSLTLVDIRTRAYMCTRINAVVSDKSLRDKSARGVGRLDYRKDYLNSPLQ